MSIPPTADQWRYPFKRLVPGDNHVIDLSFRGAPNLTGNTYSAICVNAVTGATMFTYAPSMTNAATGEVAFTATPAQTDDLDPSVAYEIRILQLTPQRHHLVTGPVTFPINAVPVAS